MIKTFSSFKDKSIFCMFFSNKCYMCIVFSALQKLNDLNKSLAEYCQQKLSKDFKAEIGQPCCAFFAGKLKSVQS